MDDACKTKEQLVEELIGLRQRVKELEETEGEHEQAEELLDAGLKEWQTIFNSVGDAICLLDSQYRILRYNKTMAEILKKPPEEIIGRTCWEVVHGTKEPVEGCPFIRMKETRCREITSIPYHERWLEVSVDPILDDRGSISGVVHIISDITERKRLEEELQKSEDTFSKAFYSSPLPMVITTISEGIITDINDNCTQLLGYQREEAVGHTTLELKVWANPEERKNFVKLLGEQGYVRDFESELRTKSGEVRKLLVSAEMINIGSQKSILSTLYDVTERKRLEEELRESEQKYSNLVEHGNDGIIIIQDGVVKYANSKMAEMTGYSVEEAVGEPFSDSISPEHKELTVERYKKRMSGEEVQARYELDIIAKDGRKINTEVNASLLEYQGKPADMAIIRDITEHKRLELEYQTIIRTALDGFWLADMQGRFLDVNDAYCKLVGYTRDELLKMGIKDVEAKEKPGEVAEHIAKIMKVGGDRFETRHRCKDGRMVDVEVSVNYIEVAGGRFFVFIRDIMKRKRMEESLRESEKKYKIVTESSPNGIYIFQDDKYKFVNEALQELGGYSREELLNMNYLDLVSPEFRVAVKKATDEAMTGDTTGLPSVSEVAIVRRDGNTRWVQIKPRLIEYEGKLAILGNVTDITELKRTEEALRDSEEFALSLLNNAPNPILVTNPDTSIRYVNPAFEKLTGFSVVELKGRKVPFPWWREEDRDEHSTRLQEDLLKLVGRHYERAFRSKSGELFWVQSSHGLVVHQDKLRYLIINWVDITERKKTEEALRESEAFTLSILNNAPHPILVVNPDTSIGYVNPALEELTGFSRAELEGRKIPFPWWIEEQYDAHFNRIRQDLIKPASRSFEMTCRKKNGELFWVQGNRAQVMHGDKLRYLIVNWVDITERRETEEALKQSELKLKRAEQLGKIGHWEFDLATQKVEWSDEVFELYERDRSLGPPTAEEEAQYYSPEEAKRLREFGRLAREKREESRYDLTAILPGGRTVFFNASMHPVMDDKGRVVKLFGTVQDITERKKAEEALRGSEEKHRTLFETMAQGVVYQSADGRIFSANPAAEKILGLTLDQMEGRTSTDPRWKAIHEDGSDFPGETHPAMIALKTGKEIKDVVMGIFNPIDERYHWISIYATPQFRSGESKPYRVYTTFTDITQRKEMEQALRESTEFALSILNNAPNPVLVSKPDNSIRYVNPAFEKLTGFSMAELEGRKVPFPWWREEDYDEHSSIAKEALISHVPTRSEEIFRKKNGELFWVDRNATPVMSEDKLKYLLVNWVDITERKKAEQALRESEEFSMSLLHNAANPTLVVNLDTSIEYLNPAFEKLTGFSEAEVRGRKPPHPWWREQDYDGYLNKVQGDLKRPGERHSEMTFRRKNGELFWIQLSAVTVMAEDKPKYLLANWVDITERKRIENTLRESEEFAFSLLNNAPNPILVVNLDTSIEYLNSAFKKLTGFSEAEIKGRKAPYPWWREQDYDGYLDKVQGDFKRLSGQHSEMTFRKKNGELFWVQLNSAPIMAGDKPKYLLANWVDITERKKAEEALRESEEFAFSLLNNAPNPVIVFNPDNSIRYVNPALEKLIGVSAAELEGRNTPFPWWRGGDYEEHYSKSREALRSHTPIRAEMIIRKKSGELCWVDRSATPIMSDGKLKYLLSNWVDITERKRMESALRLSEESFRNSLDSSPLGIRILTESGDTLYINRALLDIYGYNDIEEFRATPTQKRYTPESYAEHRIRVAKREKGEYVPSSYEVSIVRKNGEIHRLEVFRKEVLWDGSRQFQTIYSDVTERKQAEEMRRKMVEYEELSKLKTAILSTVSHELRTPLAAIKGYSTMLINYDKRLESREKRAYLQSIDKATDRLAELVSHLLDMSRLDAGLLRLEKTSTRISELIKRTVAEAQLHRTKHEIRLEIGKRLPVVNIDARRVRQVLDNLIDNACKYSREGTEVVITAKRKGKELVISITDRGVGIPPDELDKIFERMHRLEQRMAKDPGGMGLGLSLCKGLVEAHGGRIWAESEVGKGSTFYFTIPLEDKASSGK